MPKSIKEYIFKRGAAKQIPVSGTFELTPRCNMSCRMCYIHMAQNEQKCRELTTEQWLDIGRQAVEQGMLYLLLTGGEPMLRPDFCTIYREMVKMGVMVSVNTNGTLLTPQILSVLEEYQPEKVNITLYGMSEAVYKNLCGFPGGFQKTIENILLLKQSGIHVNLNTTFTRDNIDDMEEIVAFAKREHIPVRMSNFIFPPVRNHHASSAVNLTPEEAGIASAKFDLLTMEPDRIAKRREHIAKCLAEEKTEYPFDETECRAASCMAGRGAFWVSWDCNLYPCGMLPEFGTPIENSSFKEAWDKVTDRHKELLLPKECPSCKYYKLCPSCAAVSQAIHHATNIVPSEMCTRIQTYTEYFMSHST